MSGWLHSKIRTLLSGIRAVLGWLYRLCYRWYARLNVIDLQSIARKYQYFTENTTTKAKKVALLTYSKTIETPTNPNITIYPINAALSNSERHIALTAIGPVDALIDLGANSNRRTTLLDTFFHLKPGGSYVIPNATAVLRSRNPLRFRKVQSFLRDVIDRQAKNRPVRVNLGKEKDNMKRFIMGLAWGIEKVDISGRDIIFTRSSATSVRIKLREHEMDTLQKQGVFNKYKTITSISPEPFLSKATYTVYGYDKDNRAQSTNIRQPLLSLRHYKNILVAPRQVVADEHVLLPDTFRLNSRKYLINNALDELNPRAAVLRYPTKKLPKINSGVYYHLDDEHRGHFGHLLTETISRIWAWPMVKELHPDAKVLVCASKEFSYIPEYEYQFYEAAGIAREDIVLLDGPTKIGTLYSAAPMFSNPNYIHPRIVESWKLVGDNLASTAKKKKTYPTRIFCSRKQSRRACNNGEEIETLFKKNGFTIVYPEDHSLGEQVQMFRHAEVVAGYAGSSLFTVIFAENPKHVIILRPNTYAAENEFLISSVIGGRLDIIISKADDPTSNESSFTVDFENEGSDLVKILESLE